jgi:hypothetical protein
MNKKERLIRCSNWGSLKLFYLKIAGGFYISGLKIYDRSFKI